MNVKEAIALQNKAFTKKLNKLYGEPLPSRFLDESLLKGDALKIAKLIIETKKGLNDPSGFKLSSPSRFERFILWVKRQKE